MTLMSSPPRRRGSSHFWCVWLPAFAGMTAFFLFSSTLHAEETTIKGGRMELLNKGDTVRFSGGVRLNRGTDQLISENMQTNHERDKVYAQGDVKLFRKVSSTETWQAFGDKGFYDTQVGSGTLWGKGVKRARVVHTEVLSSTMSRVVNLRADRIDFYRETKRAYAQGTVSGEAVNPENGERFEFQSEIADFDGDKKIITLSGKTQSTAVQYTKEGRRTVTGDKIVYYTELKRMKSEGHARAVFEKTGKGKKKK